MMRDDNGSAAPQRRPGWWRRLLDRMGVRRGSRPAGKMTAQELFEAQQRYFAERNLGRQPDGGVQPPGAYPAPGTAPGTVPHPHQPQAPHPPQPGQGRFAAQPAAPVAPDAPPPPAGPQPGIGPESAGYPGALAPPATPTKPRQDLLTGTLAGLAMRDLTLVESMIDVVEELEDSTEDPDVLEKLFRIDNLATRMRRNGENLLVLADQDTGDPGIEPVPLLDVARAAISEISEYQRVQLGRLPELFITGDAADDISHLLAELMDNATEKSPDHAQVVISAQPMADDQLLVTVEDEGIGIPPDQLERLNSRLAGEPVLDEQVMRQMGLYVVSRIAHRHGVRVQLEARAFRGVSAHVVVPAGVFTRTGPAPEVPEPAARPAARPVFPPQPPAARPSPAATDANGDGRPTGPTQPAHPPVPQQQEKGSAMESSSVTAAGLPRRSAHRNTAPVPMSPPPGDPAGAGDGAARGDGNGADPGASRAERIRSELEGFMEGQQEAESGEH